MRYLVFLLLVLSVPVLADPTTYSRLTWIAPTTDATGAPLADLDHFNIYCGGTMDESGVAAGVTAKGVVLAGDPTGVAAATDWTFDASVTSMSGTVGCRMTAVDGVGNESAWSNTASFFCGGGSCVPLSRPLPPASVSPVP